MGIFGAVATATATEEEKRGETLTFLEKQVAALLQQVNVLQTENLVLNQTVQILDRATTVTWAQPIIQVQSLVRTVLARRSLQRFRNGTIKIQSIVRKKLAQRSLQRHRDAAVQIQRMVRTVRLERAVQKFRQNCIKVQACARMHPPRELFRRTRIATIKIQSIVRMVLIRRRTVQAQNLFRQLHDLNLFDGYRVVLAAKENNCPSTPLSTTIATIKSRFFCTG